MKNFFNPQSVAIIGASNQAGKIGNILVKNIQQNKRVKIYPVNPKRKKVDKLKCFSTVLDIAKKVDLAIIAIPAKFVLSAVEECAWKDKPIKNIIIISAGFSESGEEGKRREEQLGKLAKQYKLKILGPNCLGTINVTDNLNISFAGNELSRGSIGLIMQSGAMTTALLSRAKKEGFGFSLIATLGNKTVVGENELIDFYLQDENTKVIVLYLEDIQAGKRLNEIFQKARGKKEIVIIKAGRSGQAKKAIQSHTGSLAGEVDVFEAILKKEGVYFVTSIKQMVNLLKVLSVFRQPLTNKLTIVTNAGGPGVVTTDLIEEAKNLSLMKIEKKMQQQLKKMLPAEASIENPIDILGDALDDRYAEVMEVVVKNKAGGAILALVTPQFQTPVNKIIQAIIKANQQQRLPIYPILICELDSQMKQSLRENNLSYFTYPDDAVNGLKLYFKNKSLGEFKQSTFSKGDLIRKQKVKNILREHKKVEKSEKQVLFYREAMKLGDLYDLNILAGEYVTKNELNKIKEYPVAMKIDTPKVLHKKSQGGVVLGIKNKMELKKSINKFEKKFPGGKILVQSMIKNGIELIMGLKNDSDFGMVMLLGLGGVATEIFNEKIILPLPTSQQEIKENISGSKIAKVLKKENIEINRVVTELIKLANLGREVTEIKELDLNPIIFYEADDPIVVDIKVLF